MKPEWSDEELRSANPAVGVTVDADAIRAQAEDMPRMLSPLDNASVLTPFGQASVITKIVLDTAMRHVGIAAAHRIAADVYEQIEVHP